MSEEERRSRSSKYTTVSIPVTLYNRIKKIIEGTGFANVSQFVTYILREVVVEYEKAKETEEAFSEEEKEKIIDKLRRLGYL